MYFALPITTIAVFYALMAHMLVVSTKQMPGEGVDGHAAAKQVSAQANSASYPHRAYSTQLLYMWFSKKCFVLAAEWVL